MATSEPFISELFQTRSPPAIRAAQIEFLRRRDGARDINVAIGNVSLPMHPAMIRRMRTIADPGTPFADGAVRYTPSAGLEETRAAMLHVIASSGFSVEGLHAQITDGASQTMELVLLGVCGRAGGSERPLVVIDPTYTNYGSFAERTGRATVSVRRRLERDGTFTLPSIGEIEEVVRRSNPGGLLVIPYDNPTGQLFRKEQLLELASLAVRHNLWLVSDEAYRELHYTGEPAVSVWGITEREVPGITGRRISLESASKVWNACGLRVGALVTDNENFHRRAVVESTANLCANAMGQWVFAALGSVSHAELKDWYRRQRAYYKGLLSGLTSTLRAELPGIIVSSPDAAIYTVVDVRDLAPPGFDAMEFVLHCARAGAVAVEGRTYTLLTAPMSGFYRENGEPNPGKTQMRIAYVGSPKELELVPGLFAQLFRGYLARG